MTDPATLFTALTWACSAPLILPADPTIAPLPQITLSLRAAPEGGFEAKGQTHARGAHDPVRWEGTWISHDGDIALIGDWTGPQGGGTMRAYSQLIEANVLMLDLRQGNAGLTLRCLEDRRGA